MVFKLVTIERVEVDKYDRTKDKFKEHPFDTKNKDPEYMKSARWPIVARNIFKVQAICNVC